LLTAVAVVALALASLLQPWRSWCPSLVLTGTLLLMLLSIPGSIYARGRARAFCAGFAILGWGYFLLAFTPWFEATIGRQLLARHVAEFTCVAVTDSLGDLPGFIKTTHALFMFTFAYLGGWTASRICAKGTKRSHDRIRIRTASVAPGRDDVCRSRGYSMRRAQ